MRYAFIILLFSPIYLFGQAPKLVVGIVVDQMCYDYLYRFQNHFGKNGFNRFLEKGVNCRNTNYNYVPTYTGPGHASIYTGTAPSNHGIVGNEWYDRQVKKPVNCVFDSQYKAIGNNSSNYGFVSPQRLETMTIADQLKISYPNSKVYSISIKDRSAVLPGGQLSDGTYWYDYNSGKFITSSFYTDSLPEWVLSFNDTKNADSYLQDWNLLHSPSDYSTTIDNSPYEVLIGGKTEPVFPYLFTKFAKGQYNQFVYSPFANSLLTDFASTLIQEEKLGETKGTNMLCISYSTPDIVGHAFGPYSLEIEDLYARLDQDLSNLFSSLDNQIGKRNYIVFLTADHAVVPVPSQLQDLKLPGGYFSNKELIGAIQARLVAQFSYPFIEFEENNNIYLSHYAMDSLKLNHEIVERFVADEVLKYSQIKRVAISSDINRGVTDNLWINMIEKGYSKDRSGDVIYLLKPGYLGMDKISEETQKGTSHGSAYNYDTHVPLLWYGKQWKKKELFNPIDITDISATLVHLMNLQRMGSMTGKPIEYLLGN